MTNEEETNLENEAIFILDRMNVKELKELLKKHKAKDKEIAELKNSHQKWIDDNWYVEDGVNISQAYSLSLTIIRDKKKQIESLKAENTKLKELVKILEKDSLADSYELQSRAEIITEKENEIEDLQASLDFTENELKEWQENDKGLEEENFKLQELVGVYEFGLKHIETYQSADNNITSTMKSDLMKSIAQTALAKGQQIKEG